MQNGHRWDLSYTQNRELSWLKFNERVLAEAADKTVPLIERLRFASIFTSNLDEFFMVRVGSLFDLNMIAPDDVENKSGMTPAQQLDRVFEAVRPLIARRDEIMRELMPELAAKGVEEVDYEALTESQRAYVHDYYKDNIRPILSPPDHRPQPSLSPPEEQETLCSRAAEQQGQRRRTQGQSRSRRKGNDAGHCGRAFFCAAHPDAAGQHHPLCAHGGRACRPSQKDFQDLRG